MGDWYTIGLALGLGVALGMLFAGLLSATPLGRVAAVVARRRRRRARGGARSTTGRSSSPAPPAASSARPARRSSSPGALRRGGTRGGLALIVAAVAVGLAGLAFVPVVGYLEAVALPVARRRGCAARRPSGTRGCALSRRTDDSRAEADPDRDRRPDAVDARGHARAAHRSRARAARRARPLPPGRLDVPVADAGLPLLARDRRPPGRPRDPAPRLVPPRRAAARRVRLVVRRRARGGHAAVAAGHDLRAERQPPRPERGDGLRGARGRRADGRRGQHHLLPRAHAAPADGRVPCSPARATGRSGFFFYNLFESDVDGRAARGAEPAAAGSIDAYAAAVGRWLVTRDGFDFLVFYLSDYDYASHAQGPDAAHEALARCDDAVGALIEAAGGADEFLERYAVILCSDHGQTQVDRGGAARGHVPGRARDRVEPGGDGLLGARPRASSPRGSTAHPASTSSSTARATRRSRAGTARSSGSRRTATTRRRRDPRLSGRPRARLGGAREPERRRADRLGGRRLGVRRPRRAGTTRAAARTARCWPATRRCRC